MVTRIGPDVSDIQVGDRVVCLKKQAFATKIVVEELACATIPDSLSFDEAASMIFAFATAIHSLVNIGGLSKGQVSRESNKLIVEDTQFELFYHYHYHYH